MQIILCFMKIPTAGQCLFIYFFAALCSRLEKAVECSYRFKESLRGTYLGMVFLISERGSIWSYNGGDDRWVRACSGNGGWILVTACNENYYLLASWAVEWKEGGTRRKLVNELDVMWALIGVSD